MSNFTYKKDKKGKIRHNEKLRNVVVVISIVAFILIFKPAPIKNTNVNITMLTNRTNALYGLPNPDSYKLFMNIGPFSNKSQGLVYYFASEYGLNFTSPVMAGSSEPPLDYPLIPPVQLSNTSVPVAILISVFEYTNASSVKYPTRLNGTLYFYNDNYFASKNSYNFSLQAYTKDVYIQNATAYITTLSPTYVNLELNQLNIGYKNYLVAVAVFGIRDKYNENYTLNIGKTIYHGLQEAYNQSQK